MSMKNVFVTLIVGASAGVVGYFAGKYATERKYEKLNAVNAQEELERYYADKINNPSTDISQKETNNDSTPTEAENEQNLTEDIRATESYVDYRTYFSADGAVADSDKKAYEESTTVHEEDLYVDKVDTEIKSIFDASSKDEIMARYGDYQLIDEEEAGEAYDFYTLVCFTDGVVIDDVDEYIVTDPTLLIGDDIYNLVSDNRAHTDIMVTTGYTDTIFVRNYRLKKDYSVVIEKCTYNEYIDLYDKVPMSDPWCDEE